MPNVLVRELGQNTVVRLKQRAKQNGRSLEAELRKILNETAEAVPTDPKAIIREIRQMFAGRKFDDSAKLIRKGRDS